MVSFNEISSTLRTPGVYVEIDASQAVQGPAILPYHGLLIGQRLSTGTVSALVATRIQSASQAGLYFGLGSQLHNMAEAWFLNNGQTEVWAIAIADPAGAAATGSFAISGTSTEAGTGVFYVGGRRYPVAIPSGTAATAVGTALAAALAADTALGATGANVAGTVTLTAKHLGTVGNDLDLRVSYNSGEVLPAGISVVVTAMSGGSGDPVVSATQAPLGDQWFNVRAIPFTDATNLTAVEADLASLAGAMRHVGAIAVAGKTGSLSTASTLGNQRNSPRHQIWGTNGSPTPPWEFSAAAAAVEARYLADDPARPLKTLPLVGVLAPAIQTRWTQAERNSLLFSGISTFVVDADGTVRIERAISTYKTNAAGGADSAYLDVGTTATLDYLRYDLISFVSTRYARHKVANDDTNFGAGQLIVTPSLLRGELIGRFRDWEALGLVEDAEAFKRDLVVERNRQDPTRIDVVLPPNLVNGLQIVATRISFRL